QLYIGNELLTKTNLVVSQQRFNQTVMYGCEWDEENGITDVLFQYGHDRENFISFDLKTMTWVTPKPQAVITKHKYDSNIAVNEGYKHYLTQRCITCIKKYLQNGKSTLQRIVSILQKTPPSPVVTCHATGFYPRDGDTLPNHDGIFQIRSRLTVDPKEMKSPSGSCPVSLYPEDEVTIRLEHSGVQDQLELVIMIIQRNCECYGILVERLQSTKRTSVMLIDHFCL
uniref:MHC class I-like antigen recognition-like domain-containing protein n=1 Tax=Oncorhynchus tshawytscha TaxID=74940 RepID=A0A8C8CU80_ONCTS